MPLYTLSDPEAAMRRILVLLGLGLVVGLVTPWTPVEAEEGCCPDSNIAFEQAEEIQLVDSNIAWGDAPKGTVTGELTFSRRRPKQPIVVFLQRKGEELKFSAPADPLVIDQKDAVFDPSFAVIVRGQRVVFRNSEEKEIDHNVYTLGAESKDLGIFPRDDEVGHTFMTAGEVLVHCSIHENMDGKIFVAPNPGYAVLNHETSTFTLENIPAGDYTLRTYQKARRFQEAAVEISVAEGGTATVKVEMKR
jgi:plastocyanin